LGVLLAVPAVAVANIFVAHGVQYYRTTALFHQVPVESVPDQNLTSTNGSLRRVRPSLTGHRPCHPGAARESLKASAVAPNASKRADRADPPHGEHHEPDHARRGRGGPWGPGGEVGQK
jgi:hypothetical protein